MSRSYIVSYDIRCPKRWRKVYKIMNGFGEHWQYSVFFCVLRDIDRVRMQTMLEEVMNLNEDQCMIADLGGNEQAARDAVTVLGQGLPQAVRGTIVI
jgi:CRISPR-associated protein Cas2